MKKVKIAFFDAKSYDREFFDRANKEKKYSIKYFPNRLDPDTVGLTKDYNAAVCFVNDVLNKTVIEKLAENGIKLIALRSAGYNNVDFRAAYKKIHVMHVPAYSPNAVAEHAVGLMMSLNRKIHKAYYRTKDNNFSISGFVGFGMKGKTAGVIGTGKIGKEVIRILNGFGMDVKAYDKYPDREYASKNGYSYAGLDTVFRKSDIITLHSPLNKETKNIINKTAISKMKKGVMLINTGRGGLIDTKALIEGLKTNKVGYAGLDVYEEEDKYFFEDYSSRTVTDDVLARLLTFNNVLITSHQGFFTKEAMDKIAEDTLSNIEAFAKGKRLDNEICLKCKSRECLKEKTGRCF